jgi:hypothetical protein
MGIPSELEPLIEIDRLRSLSGIDLPAFAHDDHRFVLMLTHYAQEQGLLPRPCKVVMLDRHSDALEPRSDESAMERISEMCSHGFDYEKLLSVTRDVLSGLDDDWLVAGMEMGMFSDAVLFGVDDIGGRGETRRSDHRTDEHVIWINGSMPGELLGHQGNLSDSARGYEVASLWEILDWKVEEGRFKFVSDESVLLTIDLDAFVVDWEGFVFPWPEEVWRRRFETASTHWTTAGLTGTSFMKQVLDRTGLLAVAREPIHCGGENKMRIVFDDLNDFVFDGKLKETGPKP